MMLPEPPLMATVKSGDNAAVLRQLRRAPRRVDDDDVSGWTALHACADYQNYEAAFYLLACGADPTIENEVGMTARDSAVAQLPTGYDSALFVLYFIDAAVIRREAVRAWARYRRDVRTARREAARVSVVLKRRMGARLASWRPWLGVRYRAPAGFEPGLREVPRVEADAAATASRCRAALRAADLPPW